MTAQSSGVADYPAPARAWGMVAALFAIYVFSWLDRLAVSMLVKPIKAAMALTDAEMGLIMGPAFAFAYAVFGVPLGWAADRWPRRLVIFGGVLVWASATVACGFATSFGELLAARVCVGIGEAALLPAAYSLIGDAFPPSRVTVATSVFQAGGKTGSALAFGLGSVAIAYAATLTHIDWPVHGPAAAWQIAFFLVGLPGFLLAFLALSFPEPGRRGGDATPQPGEARRFLRRHAALAALITLAFACLAMIGYSLTAWVPSYMERHFGWQPARYGWALSSMNVLGALGLIASGRIVDWLYTRGILDAHLRFYTWTIAALSPAIVYAFMATNPYVFLACYALIQLITVPFIVYGSAIIALLAPSQLRGLLIGLLMLVFNIAGQGGGPWLIGLLNDHVFGDEAQIGRSLEPQRRGRTLGPCNILHSCAELRSTFDGRDSVPGPLAHLRVIEAAPVMPGSIAGMLLADHGAEVIKVEPVGGSCFAHDLTRKGWDRGKRSVEIDIGADPEALRGLLRTADVFIHALDDAALARLGLDDFPALVSCALTAYPAESPFHGRPHGESLVAARLGTLVDRGSSFRAGPMYLGHPALHYGQAFLAVISTLAALRARRAIGEGQAVEASLLDAFLAQSPMNHWWQEDGISYIKKGDSGAVDRFGNVRLVTAMFECGDGKFLQIHTGSGGFKPAFDILGFGDRIQAVNGPEMAFPLTDDEYQVARVEVFEAFKARPRDEWIELFQAADVAALPVLEPAEILRDPQVDFAGMRIALPDAEFGTIHQAAPAVRFSETSCATPAPAPTVGADNAALPGLLAAPVRTARPKARDIRRPLEGVRVVDFSSFFAVGFGGRLLSDLGADVIKVETPAGDQMRPLPDVFDAANRGKRDVVLDLKTPEGLAAAKRLVATADVVTHNLRPGKADKLGIGYEALKAIKPDLVYLYLPGYGSKGPKALLKAFAPLVSGWVGLLYEVGGAGNPPNRAAFGNEDYNNGFLAAAAVLMALENRDEKEFGEYVECPQMHSSLWTTSEHFLDSDMKPVYGLRADKEQQGFNALDRIYRTQDGWVCISCREDDRFAALCRATGLDAGDARFADARARSAADAALKVALDAWFASRASAAALAALDSAGAPAEIVCESNWIDEALWHDWLLASNRVIDSPQSMYGHIREFGLFNRLSKTPGLASGDGPRLGEHTVELLGEVGYSPAEIDDLLARRVAIQAADLTGRIDSQVNA